MQKASLPFNSPIWAIYFESVRNTFKVIKSQNLVSLKLYSVAIIFFSCAHLQMLARQPSARL